MGHKSLRDAWFDVDEAKAVLAGNAEDAAREPVSTPRRKLSYAISAEGIIRRALEADDVYAELNAIITDLRAENLRRGGVDHDLGCMICGLIGQSAAVMLAPMWPTSPAAMSAEVCHGQSAAHSAPWPCVEAAPCASAEFDQLHKSATVELPFEGNQTSPALPVTVLSGRKTPKAARRRFRFRTEDVAGNRA
jgi:hypothetical protein